MVITSVNPATNGVIEEYPEHTPEQVEEIIQQARAAYRSWRRTPFSERAEKMRRMAQLLRDNSDEYARLMTQEMGKLLRESRAEVEKCAWVCDYYADNAEKFLSRQYVETDASKSYISFQPIGVVLAIMPWNFPFWQVFRFAAPALMAGNVALLKHAPNVPGCALRIEELFREVGFPDNVFRTLMVDVDQVQAVIEHPLVQAATLTGSVRAGRAVASEAGQEIKKTVLELGGSDPYIILEDADLDAAVDTCLTSRMINGGQSCIAAKRLIVVESLREAFEQRYVEKMRNIRMGDPMDDDTQLGPLARQDLRDNLHDQVQRSIKQGAKLMLGGAIPDRKGAFYPATVLTNVQPGMAAFDEELFGPVAAIISAKDEADAIRLANASNYGLGAAVFTRDVERGERIAETEIEAGCCFVNEFVRSDPRLPFGGVKNSGYGRELSEFGIREFVNVKTVYLR